MADVLWVLVCLANQTGVDLTAAMEANFAKKTSRDGGAPPPQREAPGLNRRRQCAGAPKKSPVPESAEASDTGFAYGKSEKDDTASGRPRRTAAPDGCIGRSGQIPFGAISVIRIGRARRTHARCPASSPSNGEPNHLRARSARKSA